MPTNIIKFIIVFSYISDIPSICNVEEYEKQDMKDVNEIWFINILVQNISRLIMNLL
jgi:hypothetical protein